MKKILLMGTALCMVFAMSSCKSKESAYKKAYEKAKAQQEVTTTTTQQTNPVAVTPVTTTTTTPATDYSNVSVRSENVSLVSGPALKAYSVVVGSRLVVIHVVELHEPLLNVDDYVVPDALFKMKGYGEP